MDSSPDISEPSTAPSSTCNTPKTFLTTLAKYDLTEQSLLQIHNDLVTLAREAGQMMLDADPTLQPPTTKKNTSDLVTLTDRAIETMILTRLSASHPTIHFLGEETSKTNQRLTPNPTFICDPIDGTLNFIHGFPNTAVSLALAIDKIPVVGVVFNPFRGDLYTAIKHRGAFLTTPTRTFKLPLNPIPRPLPSLSSCLVALEWGSERSGANWDLRTRVAKTLLSAKEDGAGKMVRSIRSSGSAALDLCYVAAGQLDVFWEGGCWAWDVCAGWCVLEEAGGLVVGANPGEWEVELEGRRYLGVRGAKRGEQRGVVGEVWGVMGDGRFVF
ncbi:hypothetical protein BU24DRAFT_353054 [Aaosphaeria arxii CBS 175.79]|uniref:Inositol-1-monophosphatase n=1 Tax=Aaosphaeria arxii CBS 175.79 TaxID=1450172 RepID=A0A6A5XGT5_9PLEO|nr:uncharacterized protein BU24DRAFT_353054 [Aaosphaeria arxii CBS 175.79]KAF2012120.1 hypothetical protein BU24DRAFT_353054 [Aaosphaeria arxii CBS 175.79]